MTENELLLCCVAEECAEVAQRVSKALRFGLDEVQPGQPLTNGERITQELNDLWSAVDLLCERGVISADDVRLTGRAARDAKREKLLRYLEYSMGRAPHPHTPAVGASGEKR
jgi:hypothetical protein